MPQLFILMICAMVGLYLGGLINHLSRSLQPMSDAMNRLTASVSALIDQLSTNDTELGDVATALRSVAGKPSVNPEDTAALTALADRLDAATAAAKSASDAVNDVLPPPAPAAVTITLSPTSLTGTVGSGPLEGSFASSGGQAPYAYAGHSDDFANFLVNADGTYVVGTDTAGSGTAVVTSTDANGVVSAETNVAISVS